MGRTLWVFIISSCCNFSGQVPFSITEQEIVELLISVSP